MEYQRALGALIVGTLAMGTATACASKGFVRREVTDVNGRVETLSQSLEATQAANQQNQAKITDVDKKAEEVGLWAKDAQSAAVKAESTATAATAKAAAVETSSRRLIFEVVLSEDQGNFKFASTDLPDGVKVRIDEMVAQLKADPKGNFVEIEGHTDSVGNKMANQRIGQERAEAVKRYLYEQHQVPLHKMNVISYGEDKPLGPNNTKQGRAENRRVVIKVLA